LVDPGFTLPRFLFVVIVPDEWAEYAVNEVGKLVLRHCAYWVSLSHLDVVDPAEKGSVTVDVPIANLLTVDSLHALVHPTPTRES
jgi:hypothetical protein